MGIILPCQGQVDSNWCNSIWQEEKSILSLIPEPQSDSKNTLDFRDEKYIPIVFHIFWRDSTEFFTQDQIIRLVDQINQDYSGRNAQVQYTPPKLRQLIADSKIRFCLASQDPQGNVHTGITYHATNAPTIGTMKANGMDMIKHTNLGGVDAWSPQSYLNVWVGNMCCGLLGRSTFPDVANTPEDGIVIHSKAFAHQCLPYWKSTGGTLSHEIGHYLGLQHIWGPTEFAANHTCNDDDGILDTPLQKGPTFYCPSGLLNTCGEDIMYMNCMDYTDDYCYAGFTSGQAERMLNVLQVIRPELLQNNISCTAPAIEQSFNVRIQPNPVIDCFHLINLGHTPLQELIIYNALGQVQFQQSIQASEYAPMIPAESWAMGVYFCKIRSANDQIIIPFIKS